MGSPERRGGLRDLRRCAPDRCGETWGRRLLSGALANEVSARNDPSGASSGSCTVRRVSWGVALFDEPGGLTHHRLSRPVRRLRAESRVSLDSSLTLRCHCQLFSRRCGCSIGSVKQLESRGSVSLRACEIWDRLDAHFLQVFLGESTEPRGRGLRRLQVGLRSVRRSRER